MPLPFTRQELTALVVLGATGLAGVTVPLVTRVAPVALTTAAAAGPVNLNTASAAELETLPGIGPVTARRIVEDRRRRGLFLRVEDLTRVRGVSTKAIPRLKPLVRVE